MNLIDWTEPLLLLGRHHLPRPARTLRATVEKRVLAAKTAAKE